MQGIAVLLLCYLLGSLIAALIHNFIPGSVIGMILLFAALSLKLVRPGVTKKASKFLLDNMLLFFIPVSVGLITSYTLVARNIVAIIVSTILSTIMVIVVVGWMTQRLLGRDKKEAASDNETKSVDDE